LTRTELYLWCQRQGMTQAETAAHCGVSRPAVSRWARNSGVSFSRIPLADQRLGRKLEMRFYAYPWEEMQVGDYFEAECDAAPVAHHGNIRHFPKRFRSITLQGFNLVVRAA
jgi:transcriptional regulator with XRE-family HTH domain